MSVSFNMEQLFKQNSLQAKADWLRPRLQPRNMAYIGLRCVDPAERKVINDFNIPAFSMAEVDQLGIQEVSKGGGTSFSLGFQLSY